MIEIIIGLAILIILYAMVEGLYRLAKKYSLWDYDWVDIVLATLAVVTIALMAYSIGHLVLSLGGRDG